jgi:ABC-type branched-subunit amino acid transport system ATPase component
MSTEPLLRVKGLKKAFGGNVVIPGLDLDLAPFQATALIGPNGAGKTTIFNLITGFVRPDEGTVHFKGKPIAGRRPEYAFGLGIARSFQELRLFGGMSVLDNVVLGRERAGHAWRNRAANRKEVLEALAAFKLDTKLNVLARDLSYAEQKFLSMARILATGAQLLLLDEPTSGLDGPSLDLVMEMIPEFGKRGRTVLIIEHNLDVVKSIADRIVFLQGGAVIASGTAAELFARQDLADSYFGTVSE